LKNEEVSKVVKIYDVDNRCIIMELCDNWPVSDSINFQVSEKFLLMNQFLYYIFIYLFCLFVCLSSLFQVQQSMQFRNLTF
jgi:hypothetical protein